MRVNEATTTMPSSSFFSGLDQVTEQPKRTHRSNHGFPSSLQDSPYLSSPIRPIPSFSKNRSSNMSISSKRSKKVCSRPNSPAQSTVGSLRLTSPYSESIFSLHSLCTTPSKKVETERQSLSRTVLLPNEIDDMAKQLNVQTSNFQRHSELKRECGDDDEKYDMSDFDDDDSTIESDAAKSLCDEKVFQKMQVEGNDDELLYRYQDVVPNEVTIEQELTKNKIDLKDSNSPEIKLPAVNTEGDENQALTSTTPERKHKLKNQHQDRSSDSSIIRSPYAANQSKLKRSTRKKKKANESIRSSKGYK